MFLVSVRLNYLSKIYHVRMLVQQLAILECFELNDTQTYNDVLTSTQLSTDDMHKYMRPIVESTILISNDTVILDYILY